MLNFRKYTRLNRLSLIKPWTYIGYCFVLLLLTSCRKEITDKENSTSVLKYFTPGQEHKLVKVTSTKDGGFLYCGKAKNGTQNIDGFLLKVGANGNVEWFHSYGGNNYDHFEHAIECSDGGFIAVGQTNSIGRGFADGNMVKLDYIVKVKSNGALEWQKSYYPDSKGEGILFHVAESKDHHIYAAGCIYKSSFEGLNTMLMKLDLEGNLVDSSQYGDLANYPPAPIYSWNERASFVSFGEDGDVILGGTMNHPQSNFNDINFLLSVNKDSLRKVNFYYNYPDFIRGVFYIYQSPNFKSAPTVRILNEPDGYLIGTYLEDLNESFLKIQLMRTDLDGNMLWEKQYKGQGSAILYDMKKMPDGNILLIGASTDSKFNFTFSESFNYLNTLLMKVDNQGNQIWTQYGSINKNANIFKGANIATDGNITAAGLTCLSKEGFDNMFWIKLDAEGKIKLK